ncbi:MULTISPECIES: DUF1697 domain-containing protein [unclassified Streptomyces]|uniref:DUF1697 domain-containing protein n=1 Tax=unclassified Streptomyces TaxID=2593676 RepID=UPI0006AF1E63|nr:MULTISPECIES: DUF1697 domain-containing protein [unclassified Streptomyces]KOX31626.1 hypothetical protein ADL06_11010 [Streptomyces sp. NRRL F-6491]KOX48035.1 hypothetical protein ADL08_11220 [Streptomyces sp. NRRL F-6492]
MTQTYAALLRGINVSGHRKVPMAELRSLLEGLGHGDVRTHLQSGNAVFTTAAGTPEAELTAAIEDAIEDRFGFRVDCLVRDGAYLAAVADACPFPTAGVEGKQLHALYFSGPPDAGRFAAIDQEAYRPEAFALGDRVLYLYVPEGLGRSKLGDAVSRPSLSEGLVVTARNWNTVLKLVEMTREG